MRHAETTEKYEFGQSTSDSSSLGKAPLIHHHLGHVAENAQRPQKIQICWAKHLFSFTTFVLVILVLNVCLVLQKRNVRPTHLRQSVHRVYHRKLTIIPVSYPHRTLPTILPLSAHLFVVLADIY